VPAATGQDQSRNGGVARLVYEVVRDRSNASLRVLDTGVIAVAWLFGYIAGFDGAISLGIRGILPYILVAVAVQLVCNQVAGLYGPVWRYASVEEAVRVVVAVAIGTVLSSFAIAWLADYRGVRLPLLAAPPTAALLMLLGCGGFRFQARLFALERQHNRSNRLRTLIVGAGSKGVALSRELAHRPSLNATAVGYIDDDPYLANRSVRGLPVFGTIESLERVCKEQSIDRIVIALPNAPRDEVQAVVTRSLRTDAQVKILSETSAPDGEALLDNLRNLNPADLLGREPELVDSEAIGAYLKNATVLVTGAGGSIGSEIARQVLAYEPRQVLLIDRDESLLFETMTIVDDRAQPLLADIRDDLRLRDIFDRYRPDVVFHAAAHKHVPILEAHPAEAVETNLLATWILAEIAAKYGARFIQISTDKAAAPCSVMGSTKRAAEQVVLAVGRQNGLPFSAVRFGNVLGSRGSVVPTFFRQILEGGPVTVTDPDMTRYFMTIPEAVQLVLQAGAMAEERKLFLLDMGEPIRILDLARQMVRMSGLRPGRDIEIRVVGARPGERLHEQLYDETETLAPTEHPSISSVTPQLVAKSESLFSALETMRAQCMDADDADIREMLRAVLALCGVDAPAPNSSPFDDSNGLGTNAERRHVVDIDLTTLEGRRGAWRTYARPAIIGGIPAFESPLPFARPTRAPLEQVTELLAPSYDAGMLTNGPLVRRLEAEVADRLGVRHAIAVNSCSSGLLLVLRALVEGRDGPVVLPSFTFSASAHAVAWNRRLPQFVDCNPTTLQIDVARTATVIDGASALLATHVFGAPCEPAGLTAIARARNVPVVFDAAHAFGARSDQRPIGGFGMAEVFSLTPTKPLVAGEGGLVTTNDNALAESVRVGRDYGNPGDYDTQFAGLSARMSEFHAATALVGLQLLDDALARRRAIARRYCSELEGVPGVSFQEVSAHDDSTYKDFVILVEPTDLGVTRDVLASALARDGIDTRNYFDPPVHQQTAYQDVPHGDLEVTDEVSKRVIALPMFTALADGDIDRVADVIASIHEHADMINSTQDPGGPEQSRGARLGRSQAATRR
jgi:FlaA1/EpsC-like NDP-sugar epimerase/dTDP-4-amino-4,6-dideoxygalactose transaminase